MVGSRLTGGPPRRAGAHHNGITSVMIDAEGRELVFQLLDDVGVIEAQFVSGEPKPAVGRTIFVPILRRWITEGLFYRVQRLILPQQVEFEVFSSQTSINLCQNCYLEEWMEMVIFKGVGVSSSRYDQQFIIDDKLSIPDGIKVDQSPPTKRSLRAKQFSEQKIFYWKKNFIREQMLSRCTRIAWVVCISIFRKTMKSTLRKSKTPMAMRWLVPRFVCCFVMRFTVRAPTRRDEIASMTQRNWSL